MTISRRMQDRRRAPPERAGRAAASGAVLGLALFLAMPAVAAETDDLDALRQRALELANQDRAAHDLPALELQPALNAAAQAHAEDMLEDGYFAHVAPDGTGPQDRYLAAGGSRAKVVRENIARCSGCPVPPTLQRVEAFETGWMNSPEHRRNLLSEGLDGFGYGIAGADGRVYGVQLFAGPGTSPSVGPDQAAAPIPPGERSAAMVRLLDQAREGQPALAADDALAAAAADLLDQREAGGETRLFEALPSGERRNWRSLKVLTAGCGGCGTAITDADLHFFRDQWMQDPQFSAALTSERYGAVGAAFEADGEGGKQALVVLGERR
ncbi:MAG: hypothetical protein CMP81_17905 [Fulvimarina sp.]|nr:hypothetical protein [Fulvimarina sp.]